jgi:hypothetical protein
MLTSLSLRDIWSRRVARRPAPARKGRRTWLALEALEDRSVPTVVFTPRFGPETVTGSNDGMQNPSVNLIFSGPYWNTPQGQLDEKALINSTKSILSGPYLSGLTQYGSDGRATFGQSWNDSATVASNPSPAALYVFLQNSMTWHTSAWPGFSDWQHAPIYVVVSDPQSSAGFNGGWNAQGEFWVPNPFFLPIVENMHMVYVGTRVTSGGSVSKDPFTSVLSHELVETISDPDPLDGNGITVRAPAALPAPLKGDNQIGDNEPAAQRYGYRLNGVWVQPYWSQRDYAFIVPDGNTQNVFLDPIWQYNPAQNTYSFSNTYNLGVSGDQLGANYADIVLVNRSPNTGGVQVIMNGEGVEFDAGAIGAATVNTGGGTDLVRVAGLPSGVTLNVTSTRQSNDLVVVGSGGSLAAIQGTVNVTNSSGQTKLFVDASSDGARSITMTDNSLTFWGLTTINYGGGTRWTDGGVRGVTDLEVWDGKGENFVDVESVPSLTSVTLWAQTGDVIEGPAVGQIHVHRPLVLFRPPFPYPLL